MADSKYAAPAIDVVVCAHGLPKTQIMMYGVLMRALWLVQHNVAPRGRVFRQDKRVHREVLEKSRLKQRSEGFQRYGDEIDAPFSVIEQSPQYLPGTRVNNTSMRLLAAAANA